MSLGQIRRQAAHGEDRSVGWRLQDAELKSVERDVQIAAVRPSVAVISRRDLNPRVVDPISWGWPGVDVRRPDEGRLGVLVGLPDVERDLRPQRANVPAAESAPEDPLEKSDALEGKAFGPKWRRRSLGRGPADDILPDPDVAKELGRLGHPVELFGRSFAR